MRGQDASLSAGTRPRFRNCWLTPCITFSGLFSRATLIFDTSLEDPSNFVLGKTDKMSFNLGMIRSRLAFFSSAWVIAGISCVIFAANFSFGCTSKVLGLGVKNLNFGTPFWACINGIVNCKIKNVKIDLILV
jgi:hypothetical protein